ncbi:MAG TPA: EAL domain-containing protein [Paraburkholderia sp.]|jgi:diguanylate cyclase (GGDEF)-like protein/PAS domain S-box-containing protein|uniref:sensor domain-containing protein n=1 Tax=Paraburkholderia sp. TaxID=1926495 RepID=UPI002DE316A8|nr:EAL domain-containing protein [Paraburkholderia sp.]
MKTEQTRVTNSEAGLSRHTSQAESPGNLLRQMPVQNIGYSIYLLDADGLIKTWNADAAKASGFSSDEILDRHFSCFYSAEERIADVPAQHLDLARTTGKFEAEGWRVREDGVQFWAHVFIEPVYGGKGELLGFVMLVRDRSEERLLDQQTREHERSFRLLVEGVTGYAIYMLDMNGVVSNWNAGAQRAKGYQAAEIVGKHFSCFYEPADRERGLPQYGLETARQTGKFEAEGWRVRKDGRRFWAHVVIQPIYDDVGALFGFAKITRDCSEQREISLALEETTRNLDLALDNMSHGLSLFNRRGRLVLSNDQFSRILSLPDGALFAGMRLGTMLRRIGEYAGVPQDQTAGWVRKVRTQLVQRFAANQQQATMEVSRLGRSISVVTSLLSHGGWVSTIEDVTERRIAERRITHLAHHDHLTDLPNRLHFQERLSELAGNASAERPFALLFLDLDRFKSVNDTLGHHVGDELLKAVARRLSGIVRASDQLARLSGDEFAILQVPFRSVNDAAELAQRCIESLSAPFEIESNEISVGASVGIVIHARAGIDAGTVLQRADLALYAAKRDGRNGFRLYESGMNNPVRLRNELEDDLRRALRANQLELHYQPIVDAHSGIATACEALLRWRHPKRGPISPAEFIPIAEERGLMPELGAWVLEKACRDAALWPTHIRLSVNVSPAQLIHADFTRILANALANAALPAHRLEVEITETVLLESSGTSSRILNEIRAMGVGVAMDDFGKGYSSLGLLQSVPFTRVKIDRGFVNGLGNNPKSAAIIHAITELCRSLDLPITAEGVETGHQRQALLDERCHELQGFFFARPAPVIALERYLNA